MSTKERNASERTRTVTWADPALCMEEAGRMSGLDYMRALKDGEVTPPPICNLIDFKATRVEPGLTVFEITPAEYHYNPFGAVHGGIASLILDSAMACAVHSMLPKGVGYTSLEVKVNFIRPITVEAGPLICEGRAIHVGKRTATAEAKLTDKEGKVYAHGLTTCMIFRP
ncbi:PaaI family thioesterase [Syntrophorhabdus aromaticivorans]|uniref:PaaI family thioesterase n=1 Tax=Syntrophorhabdus aromaticivorans TaxID=328301 RepID=A0A351TYU3_9BACT|nr:PaaI family thioesterase [Syntrophorhabdus aromaticivorans]NLW35495.1 PaaI family thioesterase [Syntrophorhabdus aromaticivorans]HBA52874.1 PaaI family thioesterase [Syntrophorhabdus aromaticivorans]